MDSSIHPGWGTELGKGTQKPSASFQPFLCPFWPTSAPFQPYFSPFQPYFSLLQHISALFHSQPEMQCSGVAMPLSDGLHPAGAGVQDTTSPRCRPPRSLEENNYYANLNESRLQPTTGSINIKVWASIEGRGRSVINSATIRRRAPAMSWAATHCRKDGKGCGGLRSQTPSCSGAGQCQCHPKG